MSVEDRVKKIVVEHLGVDESKVNDAASFIDDLGADSLDTVELVMAFEEEFEIEIPDDGPDPHGLSIKDKILWYSDAAFPNPMRPFPEIGSIELR